MYAEGFRCIGPACEDTCCQGWNVPIDRAAWERYQSLPQSPLRILMDENIVRTQRSADAQVDTGAVHELSYANIRMNGANQCPFLTEERLCRIQAEMGESQLSHACATYPRMVRSVDGVEEKALTLSCPEAVRLVLLTPDLPVNGDGLEGESTGASEPRDSGSLPGSFWPIRALVLRLVRARFYPLWQRLFLLDLLCRRLDSIARGELKRGVPEYLSDFEAAVAGGTLKTTMETLPVDRAAQLDVVLRLAGLMLHKSNVTPRFAECVRAFTAGIGNGPGATLESLAAQYTLAHDLCYAPFFDRHPHMMENFLINTIFRCQFPFGKEGLRAGAQPQMTHEFAVLAAQFALMRGLLIGVAGHYGEAFSAEHVVHTVQAASKHFEHHPEFPSMAHALLMERGMDGARGLAILLRNAETDRGAGESRPASPAKYVAERQDGRSVSAVTPAETARPE
jgi:lysine-N-methylase